MCNACTQKKMRELLDDMAALVQQLIADEMEGGRKKVRGSLVTRARACLCGCALLVK